MEEREGVRTKSRMHWMWVTKMADRLHFLYSCLRSPSRLQCSVWSQISNGDPNRGDLVTRLITKRKCKCKLAERKETKYFLLRMRRASLHVFICLLGCIYVTPGFVRQLDVINIHNIALQHLTEPAYVGAVNFRRRKASSRLDIHKFIPHPRGF